MANFGMDLINRSCYKHAGACKLIGIVHSAKRKTDVKMKINYLEASSLPDKLNFWVESNSNILQPCSKTEGKINLSLVTYTRNRDVRIRRKYFVYT